MNTHCHSIHKILLNVRPWLTEGVLLFGVGQMEILMYSYAGAVSVGLLRVEEDVDHLLLTGSKKGKHSHGQVYLLVGTWSWTCFEEKEREG